METTDNKNKYLWYSCKRAGRLSSSQPAKEIFIHTLPLTSPGAALTLIGTVHHDPRSAAPLAQLLGELHPDQLTVEICPHFVVYRQTHGVLLQRKMGMILERLAGQSPPSASPLQDHPDIVAIRNLLGLPYEYCVASTYAQKKRIELHAIDEADTSLLKLRQVEERLISLQHLKRLASSPGGAAPSHAHRYEVARQLLSTPDVRMRAAFLKGCRGEEGIGRRDEQLAEKIRTLVHSDSGHLVHIGGWVHLIDDPGNETLYSLLKDLNPQRILLDPDHPVIP